MTVPPSPDTTEKKQKVQYGLQYPFHAVKDVIHCRQYRQLRRE